MFTKLAEQDLDDLVEYIARDKPLTAVDFVESIRDQCYTLAAEPEIGRARPELGRSLRSFPVGNYVLFYRPIQGGVEIVRVLSGHRDIPPLFDNR